MGFCEDLLANNQFKCLYFALVLVLCILVIMQLWRFGYYVEQFATFDPLDPYYGEEHSDTYMSHVENCTGSRECQDNKDPLNVLLQEHNTPVPEPNGVDELPGLTVSGGLTSGADIRHEVKFLQPGQGASNMSHDLELLTASGHLGNTLHDADHFWDI